MSDQNNREGRGPDDNEFSGEEYVLEDTGESLSDFEFPAEGTKPEATSSTAAAVPSPGDADEITRLREENGKLKDQYLRKLADFENFRKRSEREKGDYFKFALGEVIRELLPVLDNLERAVTSGGESVDDVRKGIELIQKQMVEALARHGLKPVEASEGRFDPAIHEAVFRVDDPSVPSHSVVETLQKGYFLNERLLRPALVKVAVGGEERPKESPSE